MFDEIYQEAGRNRADYFQMVPVNPFYRIFNPAGRQFDYNGDPDFILGQIDQWNPDDKASLSYTLPICLR